MNPTEHADYLNDLADKHQARLAKALAKLERTASQYLTTAPLNDGELFDLEWALASRVTLRQMIRDEYLVPVNKMITEYNDVVASSYSMIDELSAGKFTRLDPNVVSQLQQLQFQGFNHIGDEYLDIIAQQIYQSTLTGASVQSGIEFIQRTVSGRLGRYAKQQMHDGLMQFNASINVNIGKASGAKKWKYYGGRIAETREHCLKHIGKVYTEEEIKQKWKGDWAGKAEGDPFVVRGGYNCRHHWGPVFD